MWRESLRGKRVYVHGPGRFAYIAMFLEAGLVGANKLDECDIVCFTGGEDVSPHLYGEIPLHGTWSNVHRDRADDDVYQRAKRLGLVMVGICRGGQFLNVMNGGKMWQDVNNHTRPHNLQDMISGEIIRVSSTHHQMMKPNLKAADIIGIAAESTEKVSQYVRWTYDKDVIGREPDYEVLWYPETKCLCFQPHPELPGYEDCRNYFFETLDALTTTIFDFTPEEAKEA